MCGRRIGVAVEVDQSWFRWLLMEAGLMVSFTVAFVELVEVNELVQVQCDDGEIVECLFFVRVWFGLKVFDQF